MIVTIFQYIPFLEEDSIVHNSELAKKTCEDDTSGDDSDEKDAEEEALNGCFIFNINAFYSKTHTFPSNKDNYNPFFKKINIPPPKG